jgi:hypothetical protein
MCVFTDRVDKVSSTNIFAALVDPYTQLTVYSNKVALAGTDASPRVPPTFFNSSLFNGSPQTFGTGLPEPSSQFAPVGHAFHPVHPSHNVFWEPESQWSAFRPDGLQMYDSQGTPVAMVLAVPLISGNVKNIKMVDMSHSKDFFANLKVTMPSPDATFSDSFDVGTLSRQSKGVPNLAVKRCGPYRYSVVPDVDSFNRLRQNVYRVNPRVGKVLKKHYPRGYAFLVCIIDRSAEYSPIAYVHPSDGRNLFVPTLHEHGHPGEEIYTYDWDHSIYTIDRDEGTRLTDKRPVNASIVRAISKPYLPSFMYKNLDWTRLKQRTVEGYNPNGDILIRA